MHADRLKEHLPGNVLQVQDTPGYGDDLNIMNNIRAMITYIEDQNRKYLAMELDKQRTADMSDLPDPRVDCCIFCLQPHRLRPIDLRLLPLCINLMLAFPFYTLSPC